MARVCMRPGCERPAAARLSFDPVSCQAWLDGLGDRPGPAQEVCGLHADRLTLPRGWMLCDRRSDEPALFVGAATSPPAASPAASSSGARARRRRAASTARTRTGPSPAPAELFDAPVDTLEVPEPVEPVVPQALPAVASDDALELSASSPLLARAFRATGHQHSVLTEGARPVRRRADERRLDDV